jgi:hypothetical protein
LDERKVPPTSQAYPLGQTVKLVAASGDATPPGILTWPTIVSRIDAHSHGFESPDFKGN